MADLNDEFDEIFGDMGGGAQTPAAPAVPAATVDAVPEPAPPAAVPEPAPVAAAPVAESPKHVPVPEPEPVAAPVPVAEPEPFAAPAAVPEPEPFAPPVQETFTPAPAPPQQPVQPIPHAMSNGLVAAAATPTTYAPPAAQAQVVEVQVPKELTHSNTLLQQIVESGKKQEALAQKQVDFLDKICKQMDSLSTRITALEGSLQRAPAASSAYAPAPSDSSGAAVIAPPAKSTTGGSYAARPQAVRGDEKPLPPPGQRGRIMAPPGQGGAPPPVRSVNPALTAEQQKAREAMTAKLAEQREADRKRLEEEDRIRREKLQKEREEAERIRREEEERKRLEEEKRMEEERKRKEELKKKQDDLMKGLFGDSGGGDDALFGDDDGGAKGGDSLFD